MNRLFLLLTISLGFATSLTASVDKDMIAHLKKNSPTLIYKIKDFELDPLLQGKDKNIYLNRLYFSTALKFDKESNTVPTHIIKMTRKLNNEIGVKLQLNKDAKFGDGSSIRPIDIAVSIKRLMLQNKKDLEFIKGSEKITSINDEIEGLKIQTPDTLIIYYKEPLSHDFEWLANPELGIVKSEFVNLDGSLNGNPPNSGEWSITEQKDNILTLKSGNKILSLAEVDNDHLSNYIGYIGSNHLILTLTDIISQKYLDELDKNLNRFDLAGCRLIFLGIDPKISKFSNKRTRQFIAQEARKNIKKNGKIPEGSIVPVVEREYLPLSYLDKLVPEFQESEKKSILEDLKKTSIKMRGFKSFCTRNLKNTFESLGLTVEISDTPEIECTTGGIPRGEALPTMQSFLSFGKIPFFKPFVSNKELQDLLNSDLASSKKINQINKHLFQDATFSVLQHGSVVHYTTKRTNIKKHLDKVVSIEEFFYD